MNDIQFVMYTDGSANNSDRGASACIVKDLGTHQVYHVVGSFRNSTNNQAEIFSTLLGYALISCLRPGEELNVKVCSDSTYVLSSSTQHVYQWMQSGKINEPDILKNSHFWKVFLELSRNIKITPEHTPGHTGIADNERCDFAAKWVRKNLEVNPVVPQLIEIEKKSRRKLVYKDTWFVCNFNDIFFKMVMNLETPRKLAQEITAKVGEYLVLDLETRTFDDFKLSETGKKVEEAIEILKRGGISNPEVLALLNQLEEVQRIIVGDKTK
jgi:ribonuclease HI